MKEIFPGVFKQGKDIMTKDLLSDNYRVWDPKKSKPAAAFLKGLENFLIKEGTKILYLGIGEGTTASHFSDIISEKGIIIGIDVARKPFEKLLDVCEKRHNIIPILADANKPEEYEKYVVEKVDVVYCDVAQKNQTEILVKNAKKFLENKGFVMYMVKAPSIDVTADPLSIFKKEALKLENSGFKIVEIKELGPYEKDHAVIVARL